MGTAAIEAPAEPAPARRDVDVLEFTRLVKSPGVQIKKKIGDVEPRASAPTQG
jgi:hypothetical protein